MDDEQERWQDLSDRLGMLAVEIKHFERADNRASWLSGRSSENLKRLERCFDTLEDAWKQLCNASERP
jgi:hypothetical protein